MAEVRGLVELSVECVVELRWRRALGDKNKDFEEVEGGRLRQSTPRETRAVSSFAADVHSF